MTALRSHFAAVPRGLNIIHDKMLVAYHVMYTRALFSVQPAPYAVVLLDWIGLDLLPNPIHPIILES